jgi:hypothetical protein
MMSRTATQNIPSRTGVRWSDDDLKMLRVLHKKFGLSVMQLIRLGLRALLEKEGLSA